jgi:hypothetical protein
VQICHQAEILSYICCCRARSYSPKYVLLLFSAYLLAPITTMFSHGGGGLI